MLTRNRIYHPTEEEIAATLAHAAGRAPSLNSRLNRAGDLLRAGALHFVQGEWRCRGTGEPGEPSSTCRMDFTSCECLDCRERRAVVGGFAYCEHLLALFAYRRICLDHLNEHIVGELGDAFVCREARRAANAALLLAAGGEPGRPALFAWADACHLRPRCICSLAKGPHGLVFASPGHLGAFAEWLGQAQPLPAELEALMLYRRLRALGFHDEDAAEAADAALVSAPAAARMAA
jgi:hypothetical protein